MNGGTVNSCAARREPSLRAMSRLAALQKIDAAEMAISPRLDASRMTFISREDMGMESPPSAERLMTPTADDRGGSVSWDPPRGGFFVASSCSSRINLPA